MKKAILTVLAVVLSTYMSAQGLSSNSKISRTGMANARLITEEAYQQSAGDADDDSEEYMVIEKTDGSSIKVGVDKVRQVFFEKPDKSWGKVAEPIDLGLSVDWASWDLGASKVGEFGGLYGWADPTGLQKSTNPSDYPSSNPPSEISGTSYDIAHEKWGGDWRLPTYAELKELFEQCDWYQYYLNGDSCIMVVGPNGNSIVLPFAGSRYGEEKRDPKTGFFWTGTLFEEDAKFAWGVEFNHDAHRMGGLNRLWGFNVRPVRKSNRPETTLSVYPTSIILESQKGANATLSIKSNADWEISGLPSWLTVSKNSGNGDTDVTLTTTEQYSGVSDRAAETITISSKTGGKQASVSISQKGVGELFSISPETITLGSRKGSTATVSISSNTDWTITDIPSWASFSEKAGNGNKEVTITANEQYEGANDRSKVSVILATKSGNIKATLQLSQKGVGMSFSVSGSPVNLSSEAGATGTFTVNTNADFAIRSNVEWLEVTPTRGNTTTQVTVRALSANPNTVERTGTIYVQNALFGAYAVSVVQAPGTANVYFEEPFIEWGTSRSTVKSVMKDNGYILMNESNSASENYYINYLGKGKETVSQYWFDSSQSLTDVYFLFLEKNLSLADLREYLVKTLSYQFAATGGDATSPSYFYLTKDKKSYALVWSTTNNGEAVTMMRFVSYSRVVLNARPSTRGGAEVSFEHGSIIQ